MSKLEHMTLSEESAGSWGTRGRPLDATFLQKLAAASGHLTRANVLITIGVMGLLVRIPLVVRSLGSNDITTWVGFGRAIRMTGLGAVYDTIPLFNHPPIMGWWAALADTLAETFHTRFEVIFKTPVIVADGLGAVMVYRCWKDRQGPTYAALVFCLFCWNPVSLWVSAYHGNTDSLCAMLVLLAALSMDRGRPFVAGLALAGSVNVKLIGLLLIPVLLSRARTWKQAGYVIGALGIGAVPFLPFAWFHSNTFYAHVVGYRSMPGYWGITLFLRTLASTPRWAGVSASMGHKYAKLGVKLVMAAPLALSLINWGAARWGTGRRWSARQMSAIVYGMFLLLTPGFGIQYTVYPVLPLFAVSSRYAIGYALAAGSYVSLIYLGLWTGTSPAFSDFTNPYPLGSQALGFITWGLLLQAMVDLLRAQEANGPRRLQESI